MISVLTGFTGREVSLNSRYQQGAAQFESCPLYLASTIAPKLVCYSQAGHHPFWNKIQHTDSGSDIILHLLMECLGTGVLCSQDEIGCPRLGKGIQVIMFQLAVFTDSFFPNCFIHFVKYWRWMLLSFSSSALYVFILQKKKNSWMEEGKHLKVKWELEVACLTLIPFEEL